MDSPDEKNAHNWKLLQVQVQEQRIAKLFGIFQRHDIEALLIKGWAAARNYPQPFHRLSVDTDAAVRPDSFDECREILRKETIPMVDLHKGLRHLDKLAWTDLYAAAETVRIGDASVKIPCAEDHLRILCVHWLNDGGVDRERLRDIYYAVQNRPADFDWNRCLDAAGARRRKWVVCVIGLTAKYLGLDIKDTPVAAEAMDLPEWIIRTIEREWKRGVRIKPLDDCLRDGDGFFQQLKLRISPNPLQATIEMDGDLDAWTKIPYQASRFISRIGPSARKIGRALKEKS